MVKTVKSFYSYGIVTITHLFEGVKSICANVPHKVKFCVDLMEMEEAVAAFQLC